MYPIIMIITVALKGAIMYPIIMIIIVALKGAIMYPIIMIIIVALKGAIREVLQSPHCAVSCLQHVRSSSPGVIVCKSHATHRALIMCNLQCTTWYEGTPELFSLTEFKSHLF